MKRYWIAFYIIFIYSLFIGTCLAHSSPVYLTLDTGLTAFKWGAYQTGLGFPHFEPPKWDVEPGIEWTPSFLERKGIWIRASFPWQALGHSATFFHQGQTYIDGPRIGIRFRGRIIQ